MNLKYNTIIAKYASGKEDELVDAYIQQGPALLQVKLCLTDEEWGFVFDHLVFQHNLLYKTVVHSADFFVNEYTNYGISHVRELLSIDEEKYDVIWEALFDFIAIANDSVYYHFLQNREKYVHAFKVRGGDHLKRALGLFKAKYSYYWEKILNSLHTGFCEDTFKEFDFDHSLDGFIKLINAMREHRMPVK